MGILDDAIREHLELKRQHGAAEDELQELEDDAFGSAERPGATAVDDSYADAPTEFMAQPEAAQQQEPPVAEEEAPADIPEAPPQSPSGSEPAPPAEAAEEEHPAMEHELPPSPTSEEEERRALADQPTEMYDIESEFTAEETAPQEDEGDAGEAEAEDDEDEFFDEKSLSDELDQALDAPPEESGESEPADAGSDEEQEADAGTEEEWQESGEDDSGGDEAPASDEEDVLEETPEFLQDTPESERLWFEQKPPKDFDFDD